MVAMMILNGGNTLKSFGGALIGAALALTQASLALDAEPAETSRLSSPNNLCTNGDYERLRQAADRGDQAAQTEFAELLIHGACERPDTIAAIDYLKRAADSGDAQAAYALGEIYFMANTDADTLEHARLFFKQAAETGHVEAKHRLGLSVLLLAKDDAERFLGLAHLGEAASAGHGLSAASLAAMHELGLHGVQSDPCVALDWYRAAEMIGFVAAASRRKQIEDVWRSDCY